ncbi:hypothetical protein D9M69_666850 [compost metagenome]
MARVGGQDAFHEPGADFPGEELDEGAYQQADRIAEVALQVRRPGKKAERSARASRRKGVGPKRVIQP